MHPTLELVVPSRLEKAKAKALDGITLPEASSPLHMLHVIERAHTEAISANRTNLRYYLDHIRVEAAMRGQLNQVEARVQAIEEQVTPVASIEHLQSLKQQATALEDSIRTPLLRGTQPSLSNAEGMGGLMNMDPMLQMLVVTGALG